MSKKSKKKSPSSVQVKTTSKQAPPVFADIDGAVRAHIAAERFKAALDLAKTATKDFPGPAAEALLIDAYIARIRGMMDKDMIREALALLEVAAARFPAEAARFAELRARGRVRKGDLAGLVAPLADPDLPPERRAEIEATITAEVIDLAALAKCDALPEEHPLRRNAAELNAAFTRVTSGPVTDEELALPGVPRRSPLAPWKLLVRAIALFHRGENGACLECAERIPVDAAPARLVPALRHLCGEEEDGAPPRTAALRKRIFGHSQKLTQTLERFTSEMGWGNPKRGFASARSAVTICRNERPDLLEELQQRIELFVLPAQLPADQSLALFGFTPVRNARYWQIAACAAQRNGDLGFARSAWEECRIHAIHEGWFSRGDAVEAALLMHIAELEPSDDDDDDYDYDEFDDDDDDDDYDYGEFDDAIRLPSDETAMQRYYMDQEPDLRNARNAARAESPAIHHQSHEIFARACALDPRAEYFKRWYHAAMHDSSAGDGDTVLLAWAEALPDDPQPYIMLARDAVRTNALKRAAGYFEQAEARDAMNPELRRLRFRVGVLVALRHIKDGKPHLLRKDIALIGQLRRDSGPLMDGLAWAAALLEKDESEAAERFKRIGELLGGDLAAALFVGGIASAAEKRNAHWTLPEINARRAGTPEGIVEVARAFKTARDNCIPIVTTDAMLDALQRALCKKSVAVAESDLLGLAESALACNMMEIAYDASGAGLRLDGELTPRLLAVRAQTLSGHQTLRTLYGLCAARVLAEKALDRALVDEIGPLIGAARRSYVAHPLGTWSLEDALRLSEGRARSVMQLERTQIAPDTRLKFPKNYVLGLDNLDNKSKSTSSKKSMNTKVKAVKQEMLDFIAARMGRRGDLGDRAYAEFEQYCAAVPLFNEQWNALKARYEKAAGVPFKFSALH